MRDYYGGYALGLLEAAKWRGIDLADVLITLTQKGTHTMISDQRAQEIAGDWHGGGGSALYQFASTGAITHGLGAEIQDNLRWCWAHRGTPESFHYVDLMHLRDYVSTIGERGPVTGWYARVICA